MGTTHFSPWTRRLHWLVFVLVTVALILIYTHGWLPKGSAIRTQFKWVHKQLGMTILLLMLPRVIARWCGGHPPIVRPLSSWQERLAQLVQYLLYALLFAVPMLGIGNRLWSPDPWDFFGIPLPHVAVTDKIFSNQLRSIHETLGNALMYLAGAHAAAALAHHFMLRDSTLRGMLPFWRRVDIIRADSRTSTEAKGE